MANGTKYSGADPHAHKPNNSLFKQQRLPAWQPVMSPPYVVGCLFLVAVFFIPIGVSIIVANNGAYIKELRYDDRCPKSIRNTPAAAAVNITYVDGGRTIVVPQGCLTTISFTVDQDMPPPVYMYYKLTNFYQNHRKFVRSRSEVQLAGGSRTKSDVTDCSPLITPGSLSGKPESTPLTIGSNAYTYASMLYAPCGLVAWSMFNDTFVLSNSTSTICNTAAFDKTIQARPTASGMSCNKAGITWESDAEKFTAPLFSDTVWTGLRQLYHGDTPTAWWNNVNTSDVYLRNGWYADEPGHSVPISTDLDLIVWSRTASMPTFLKLYRVINTTLKARTNYTMTIYDVYDTSDFNGQKFFSLQTTSWIGGKNDFLGTAYVVIGGFCVLLACVLFVLYRVMPNRTDEAISQLEADQ
jgi:hypothetical protein